MSKSFQQTQLEFAKWLRSPHAAETGFGDIEPRRLAIYRRLIHANIRQFISSGFPVLQSLLTEQQWQQLLTEFVAQHRSDSPLFSDIGSEFVSFLTSDGVRLEDYPGWLFDLARYERMEVDVQFASLSTDYQPLTLRSETQYLHLNPTAEIGIFDYPVAQINSDFQPQQPLATPYFVLVYQIPAGQVQFIELNSLTALALDLLQQKPRNLVQLSEALAQQLPDFSVQQLREAFTTVATDFAERFVLLDKP
ncbi:HvfC family RiPP maturation protein [Pseudidiomarina sp. E22-M8]|uniref:HvfC family RiPP maturation protein n=1 Tax=Pseudidiomarina sp. E22-M8 TaxID=3424768 RepID=UPI00403C0BD3